MSLPQKKPAMTTEPATSARFVLDDNIDEETYRYYKKALASFWVAESIDLASDKKAFDALKPTEKRFLLMVLAFFAGSDGIVLENIACNFYGQVQQPEVRLFYGFQMCIENIHSETYSLLIRAYERDADKRKELFRSIDDMPAVSAKAQWALRYIDAKDPPFAERLVAFACVEGILFSSSFCAIFYLRKRGFELPGLFQSNEYISRDEGLHCEFACHLHRKLPTPCPPDKILEIVRSAVQVEKIFVDSALADDLLGMNRSLMFQYVQFVADVVLQLLDCPKHFKVANPFDFMTPISLSTKTNFFERRVTDYSIAEVTPSFTNNNDDDF